MSEISAPNSVIVGCANPAHAPPSVKAPTQSSSPAGIPSNSTAPISTAEEGVGVTAHDAGSSLRYSHPSSSVASALKLKALVSVHPKTSNSSQTPSPSSSFRHTPSQSYPSSGAVPAQSQSPGPMPSPPHTPHSSGYMQSPLSSVAFIS